MSLSRHPPGHLGKRKRVCEPCARRNQPCDFKDDAISSCQACISAGLACNSPTAIGTPAIALPQPVSWQQSSPASRSLSFTSEHSNPITSGIRMNPQNGMVLPNSTNGSNKGIGSSEGGTMPMILPRFTEGSPGGNVNLGISSGEVPLWAAASFFRTYFTVIHPQYPFLDIETCAAYYKQWKAFLLLPQSSPGGWPNYFVHMILAIGSLIESKSECSPYPQYQSLIERAQAEQAIMEDSSSDPLIRLQAMLLSAMFALHAESTWRIVHLSGATMKFATLHRFHRLKSEPNKRADSLPIRVWSCVYALDRVVSSALYSPVSLPDMYITSPLLEATAPELEEAKPQPWLADCIMQENPTYTDSRTFAHICKVRKLSSFFLHMVEKDELEDSVPKELELHMLHSLREWEDSTAIANHSLKDSFGYQSPLWLQHICAVARMSIFFVHKSDITSPSAEAALDACCAVCTSFRSLQKKKRMAQPWLVVIAQFRAVVTLLYIVWAQAVPLPRKVNDAFRNCSAVLAIFADRWPRAELYRDCFELLAKAIPRCQPLGSLSADVTRELSAFKSKLEESGIHRTTSRMLGEMCSQTETPLGE